MLSLFFLIVALKISHIGAFGFRSVQERPILCIFQGQPFPVLEVRFVELDQLFDFRICHSKPQTCGSMMGRSLRAVIGDRNGNHYLLSQLLVEFAEG